MGRVSMNEYLSPLVEENNTILILHYPIVQTSNNLFSLETTIITQCFLGDILVLFINKVSRNFI